jgi:hypothetical protein
MAVRNIGIVGYAVVYPAAAALIARYFGAERFRSVQPASDSELRPNES